MPDVLNARPSACHARNAANVTDAKRPDHTLAPIQPVPAKRRTVQPVRNRADTGAQAVAVYSTASPEASDTYTHIPGACPAMCTSRALHTGRHHPRSTDRHLRSHRPAPSGPTAGPRRRHGQHQFPRYVNRTSHESAYIASPPSPNRYTGRRPNELRRIGVGGTPYRLAEILVHLNGQYPRDSRQNN